MLLDHDIQDLLKNWQELVLNWIFGQTRPDIAYESCEASVAFKEAKVSDVLKANKAV